jgi:hypothetical protein
MNKGSPNVLIKKGNSKKDLASYMEAVQRILGDPFCEHQKLHPPESFEFCIVHKIWECPRCRHG